MEYLTFCLNNDTFAINVNNVTGIIEIPVYTKVPNSHDYLLGIMNLREVALPIINARIVLGLEPVEFTKNTCVVVINTTDQDEVDTSFGILVDNVESVLEYNNPILPLPKVGINYNRELITGLLQKSEEYILLLAPEKLITMEEVLELNEK